MGYNEGRMILGDVGGTRYATVVNAVTLDNGAPISTKADLKTALGTPLAHTHTAADITNFNTTVNGLIAAVVGAAPNALDTLVEIDNAIGNDPNFATTMTTALAGKQAKFTDTAAKYVRGDGSVATLNSDAVPEGTTNLYNKARVYTTAPIRTIGTAFQVSTARDADVVYSIPIQCAAVVLTGARGQATWKYADDAAMTVNAVTLPPDDFGVGSGLITTGNGTLKLVGKIPAGKYVKITTVNVTGTPTYGAIVGQETLI